DGDGDLAQTGLTFNVGDGDSAGHIRERQDLIVGCTELAVRAGSQDHHVWRGYVIIDGAIKSVGAGSEERLRLGQKYTVSRSTSSGDVTYVGPGENLGIARGENCFHGLL